MARLSPEHKAGPPGQVGCLKAERAAFAAQASAARVVAPQGMACVRVRTLCQGASQAGLVQTTAAPAATSLPCA
eukprot:7326698-Lingulodinium_polyedra.AAC.1